jgi:hypothetical protein
MLSLPLDKESRNNEWKTILNIARNINFPYKLIINLKHQLQHYTPQDQQQRKQKQYKMCHFHISQFESQEDNQPFQTHQSQNSIQK